MDSRIFHRDLPTVIMKKPSGILHVTQYMEQEDENSDMKELIRIIAQAPVEEPGVVSVTEIGEK